MNTVADALSRIKVDNSFDEPSKTVFVVRTRSKTVLDSSKPPTNIDFYVEEFNNLQVEIGNFDHIFYFIDYYKSKMFKELQHKLKKIIKIDNFKMGNIFEIDDNRSVAIIISSLLTQIQIDICNQSLSEVLKFCLANDFSNIAFNIEIRDAKSYFQFKALIANLFKPHTIKISFFLCKIIELCELDDIKKVTDEFHLTPLGGHVSFSRMYNTIKKYYSWYHMRYDIKKYCRVCETCQKNKVSTKPKQPINITSTAHRAMEVISFDHCGRINPPTPRSNAYILILQCTLTKYVFAFPVPDNSADTTARYSVENVFLLFGIPQTIVSDCHPSFTGEIFKKK